MTPKEKELLRNGAISKKTLCDIYLAGKDITYDLSGKETTIEYFGERILEKLLQNDS